ncbi:MAG: anti-sigma factor family protein [Phycisphaerae bacterium]
MNCEQAHNLFDAYLDGELSPGLETELHAHRLGCSACRQELALMEVAGHVISSTDGDPQLPGGFTDRLLACIEPEVIRPGRIRTWSLRLGCGLAAAACLVLLVGHFSKPGPVVLGTRTEGAGAVVVDRPADEGSVVGKLEFHPPMATAPLPSAGLNEAAQVLRRTVEETLRDTQQSSRSLARFGQATLLQMIDALQLEALRDGEPDFDEGVDPPAADENVDELEQL